MAEIRIGTPAGVKVKKEWNETLSGVRADWQIARGPPHWRGAAHKSPACLMCGTVTNPRPV